MTPSQPTPDTDVVDRATFKRVLRGAVVLPVALTLVLVAILLWQIGQR